MCKYKSRVFLALSLFFVSNLLNAANDTQAEPLPDIEPITTKPVEHQTRGHGLTCNPFSEARDYYRRIVKYDLPGDRHDRIITAARVADMLEQRRTARAQARARASEGEILHDCH